MDALRCFGADERMVRGSDRGAPCRRAGFATGRLVAILALLGLAFLLARTGTLVRADSADMAPGLLEGDLVHVYTRAYAAGEPARGDVAAFRLAVDGSRRFAPDRMPGLPTGVFLGRIVGLPGDVVESNRNALRINGERLRQVRMPHSYRDPGGKPLYFHELILGKRRGDRNVDVVANHIDRVGGDVFLDVLDVLLERLDALVRLGERLAVPLATLRPVAQGR